MKTVTGILTLYVALLFLNSCKPPESEPKEEQEHYVLEVPAGFPEPDIPEDNQLTAERVALGKKLFFDPILSLDSTISCGSCHFQHKAFSDTVAISIGVHGQNGMRNAQPLINVAYNSSFFRDGGVPTLEQQIIAPIQTEEEMNLNIIHAVERLKQHPEYPDLIRKAYDRDVDPFSITRAIAAFVRTMISGNSKYDQYTYGNNKSALNGAELAGMELFFSDRTKCSSCHSGFNFTSQQLVNNGFFESFGEDPGRERITLRPEDRGKFKVPTLRNIALTAPYMHNGSYGTLEEIIDEYAAGSKDSPNKSPLITGFEISKEEKSNLIAFLNALTDKGFIENKAFNP